MTDDRDLDRLLGRLADDGRDRPDPAEHPSDGTLSFYHARKLLPEEEGWVREHLVECKRCRDLLLEYAEFMEDEEEEKPEGVADFGAAADWQRLRGVAVTAEGTTRVDRAYEPGTPRSFFRSLKTAYSIAAVLALAVVGLSVYVVKQEQDLTKPKLNQQWHVLLSEDSSRAGSGSGDLLEIPVGTNFTIEIPARDLDPHSFYRFDVYHKDKRLYSIPGLVVQDPENNPLFRFSWENLGQEPGRYEVHILNTGGGVRKEVGRYSFIFLDK